MHGIAGALWSAFRRLLSVPGGIRAITISAAVLLAVHQAHASLITATITGTVTSGMDVVLPTTNVNLAGDPFSLVYTIDDTQGTGTIINSNGSGQPFESYIENTPTSNPITAVLTVAGKSYDFGTNANIDTLLTTKVLRDVNPATTASNCPVGSCFMNFNISEAYSSGATKGSDSLGNFILSTGKPFSTSYNWEAPISYNIPSSPNSENTFSWSTKSGSNTTNPTGETIEGTLDATKITISGPAMPPPTPKPQVVYLDFGSGDAVIARNMANPQQFIPPTHYMKDDAGLTPSQEGTVRDAVQRLYTGYNVQFTTDLPAAGTSYDTIYIGGTPQSELTSNIQGQISSNTLGLTATLGIANSVPDNTAVVFSGKPNFSTTCLGGTIKCPNLPLLSQVIAHEAGHIFGLVHTDSEFQFDCQATDTLSSFPSCGLLTDLMSPVSNANSVIITRGPVPIVSLSADGVISTIDSSGIDFGNQNSDANLQCGLGLAMSGNKDCSGVIGFTNTDFSLASTAPMIFGAEILIERPGDDDDVGAMAYALGTIGPGFSRTLDLPLSPDDIFAVEGALTPGGTITFFDLESIDLGGSDPKLVSGGVLLNTASVPEPGSGLVLITGIVCLLWLISWRSGRELRR